MLTGKGLLSSLQRDFLRLFSIIPDQKRFYLTGGTPLAEYYLGHRISFDLDIFTAEPELVLPVSFQVQEMCTTQNLGLSVARRFSSYVEFVISREEESLKVDWLSIPPFVLSRQSNLI